MEEVQSYWIIKCLTNLSLLFSEIAETMPFPQLFNDLPFSDSPNERFSQRSRHYSNGSSSGRGSMPSPGQEERDLANIQSAMSLPSTLNPPSRGTSLQFPYDSAQHPNQIYGFNNFDTRGQGITEESGMTYYEDRLSGHHYSYKHQLELAGPNFNGPFLTQELERLHMSYGTENLFDRNYFFQRELRA